MDDDYDPNVSGGGSRGSTSLPKFNHLYPILFFSHFIRFCGANKCGGPLSSPDGRIESIVTLEESHAVEEAEMPTPYAGLTIEATRYWSKLMIRPVTLL